MDQDFFESIGVILLVETNDSVLFFFDEEEEESLSSRRSEGFWAGFFTVEEEGEEESGSSFSSARWILDAMESGFWTPWAMKLEMTLPRSSGISLGMLWLALEKTWREAFWSLK